MAGADNRHTRCCALILNGRGQLLLLEHLNAQGVSYWWLPGGGLEEGESFEEGIRREIREELGVDVELDEVFTLPAFNPARHYRQFAVGVGRVCPGQRISLEREKHHLLSCRWFDLATPDESALDPVLHEIDILPFVRLARKRLGLY